MPADFEVRLLRLFVGHLFVLFVLFILFILVDLNEFEVTTYMVDSAAIWDIHAVAKLKFARFDEYVGKCRASQECIVVDPGYVFRYVQRLEAGAIPEGCPIDRPK